LYLKISKFFISRLEDFAKVRNKTIQNKGNDTIKDFAFWKGFYLPKSEISLIV
jgi:hypothetical protein